MKQLLLTIMMIAGLSVSSLTQAADLNGSVGLSSDYFFRGASQNAGEPSLSVNLNLDSDSGWYAGMFAAQTDLGMDNSLEYDFWAGYGVKLTEDLSIHGGMIRYDYDKGLDSIDEAFIGGSYKSLSMDYYMDIDNSDLTYLEVGYQLPYINVVDIELNYGRFNDGENVVGFTISKDVGNASFSLMILEEARHGKVMDSAALGIHYNF